MYSAQVSSSQSTEVLTGDKSPVKRPGPPVVVGLGGGLTALPSPMRRRIQNSPSLKEIMEEERAIELSKREFVSTLNCVYVTVSMCVIFEHNLCTYSQEEDLEIPK